MQQTPLLGAYLIQLPVANDNRGVFVKSFHAPSLAEGGINFDLKESYYSFSHKNVIRGMHFQLPTGSPEASAVAASAASPFCVPHQTSQRSAV